MCIKLELSTILPKATAFNDEFSSHFYTYTLHGCFGAERFRYIEEIGIPN